MLSYHVIRLKRGDRVANVARMQKELPELQIYNALDHRHLKTADIKGFKQAGYLCENTERFSKNQLAIWLSHVTLWEELEAGSPAKYHVIFEDDVQISPKFRQNLAKYLPRLERMAADFAHFYIFPQQFERFNIKRRGIYKTPQGLWGTQCYFVHHDKLEWLLGAIKPMDNPIDEQVTRCGAGFRPRATKERREMQPRATNAAKKQKPFVLPPKGRDEEAKGRVTKPKEAFKTFVVNDEFVSHGHLPTRNKYVKFVEKLN